ncbi:hypothetical protein M413DRAFT_258929 [Hebeloma cylindrosporum]|uniref:Uncharacterized protein n=1 Tax=Hebeloma cylindrosporum TaxID=76867 RepID=A0A0C2XIL9_HEBCY|nr:hypothetical protein M413DRAFT_258929 [Hebeloma cylindrosporum h7]
MDCIYLSRLSPDSDQKESFKAIDRTSLDSLRLRNKALNFPFWFTEFVKYVPTKVNRFSNVILCQNHVQRNLFFLEIFLEEQWPTAPSSASRTRFNVRIGVAFFSFEYKIHRKGREKFQTDLYLLLSPKDLKDNVPARTDFPQC